MHTVNVPQNDLNEITEALSSVGSNLKNAKIFLTGGTGFFGIWLIESFLALNKHYYLNAELWILSRDPERFLTKFPRLQQEKHLHFMTGDIQHFSFPDSGITHVIHAATAADIHAIENHPLEMIDTIVNGTRRVLEGCVAAKTHPKMLFTSSGAVYGAQPADLTHIPESFPVHPDLYGIRGSYAVGKCMAEHLCYQYHRLYDLPIKIARCFAFVGPHLPLDGSFAIGNFMADRLANRPITVKAKAQVFRSYQYPSDLMIWLWTILMSGQNVTPYNIGSDEDHTLQEFAQIVADSSTSPLSVLAEDINPSLISRYVPSIAFAKQSLGLYNRVNCKEAIKRTLAWHDGQAT